MAINGLSPESMLAMVQAKEAQRRQQEAAQKQAAAAQQAQQAQQGGAQQPGQPAGAGAAKPATDLGAACDHNNAVAQKWDGFRGPENKVDAVANQGDNLADGQRQDLYKQLGDDRAAKPDVSMGLGSEQEMTGAPKQDLSMGLGSKDEMLGKPAVNAPAANAPAANAAAKPDVSMGLGTEQEMVGPPRQDLSMGLGSKDEMLGKPTVNAPATPAATSPATTPAAPTTPAPAAAPAARAPLTGEALVNAQRAGVAAATARGEKFEVLSEQGVKQATAQLQQVDGALTQQKGVVAAKRQEIEGQVKALEAQPTRTTPQDALLQGKKGQVDVLAKAEQHLEAQKAVVGAAITAVSDGVATETEANALKTAQTALNQGAQAIAALDSQASNLVARAERAGATVPATPATTASPTSSTAPAAGTAATNETATAATTAAATPATQTALDRTLAANPNVKSNQDLINHYYKQGGGTWEGASRLATTDGQNLNQLIRNRQGAPGSTAAPAAGTTAPSRPGDTTGAAPTTPATTAPETQGVNRSIRPFREVDQAKLEAALPANAKHLAKSFIDEGRKNNIDPVALAAISKHETGNFTSSAFKNKNNAMGISDKNGPTMQKSAEDSIAKMAKGLANPNGYYKGKNTLGEIANVYAPIGANNDPTGLNNHWGKGVAKFADDFAARVRPDGTAASTSTTPNAAAGTTAPGATAPPANGAAPATGVTGPAPAAGSINERIAAATRNYMGTSTRTGPDGGNLACAWAVNNILRDAGLAKIGSNTNLVRSVEAGLRGGRGTPVTAAQARPGDIVIWPAPRSHIGIMSDGGRVANNSSSRASFTNLQALPAGARIYRVTN